MLPPVLEIYVVWHPGDLEGTAIADEIIAHFHGTAFTGLIGGAVEVFVRSSGWRTQLDAPRAIPLPGSPPPNGVAPARYTIIVPLLGNELASAVQTAGSAWDLFLQTFVDSQRSEPALVQVLPYRIDHGATEGTRLGGLLGGYQAFAGTETDPDVDPPANCRCRELSQAITQFLSDKKRLTAFISHTKRSSPTDDADVSALVQLVRNVIGTTHLQSFFDASDLQPGCDWDEELRKHASASALLAVRTDLYPSRSWCQREVLLAKQNGMPVITLDAIGQGEERGCFLMDHVPRVPIRVEAHTWSRRDVYRALNVLVDECLKRALWSRQRELAEARPELGVSWWAPHAPEPVTLINWLLTAEANGGLPDAATPLRILHPDPPLGPDERLVLQQILTLGRVANALEVMTPRQLAARGA